MQRVGPYELIAELGRGGMGVVHRARDARDGREVALKVVLAAADPDALARFGVELAAVGRLRHPNVVALHDAGVVDGKPFLAMELVRGESLRERLKREGPPPAREVAAILEKLARALQAAHEAGVLHRDVKPENVLLGEHGEPQLVDFGLACIEGGQRLTATGTMLGTPAYMAPELADGARRRLGPWTDVYGLGALLYELLAGRPPFVGTSRLAIIKAVLEREPTPPGAVRPGVDPALEAICLRCLCKEPARRFLSAAALADALAKARTELARPARRGRGRAPLVLAAAAVGVVGLVVVATIAGAPRDVPVVAATPPAPPPPGPAPVPVPSPAPPPASPPTTAQAQGTARLSPEERAHAVLDRQLGDPIGALADARAWVDAEPRSMVALETCAEVLMNTAHPEDAMPFLERAMALDPRDPDPLLLRSEVREEQEDIDGAVADVVRALELDPEYAPAHAQRAHLHMARRELREAEASATRAVTLDPKDAVGWYVRGVARVRRSEEAPGAREDLERALSLLTPGGHPHRAGAPAAGGARAP